MQIELSANDMLYMQYFTFNIQVHAKCPATHGNYIISNIEIETINMLLYDKRIETNYMLFHMIGNLLRRPI